MCRPRRSRQRRGKKQGTDTLRTDPALPPADSLCARAPMEAKAKSAGSGAQKAAPAPKAEKPAEKAPPRKESPVPADPPPPAAPAPENPPEDGAPSQDGAPDNRPEAAPEGADAGEAGTDSLESLKPFLIAGAVVAVAAVLLGALLLARRN
ncbi:hypothetical protein COCON_G00110640 [Conger conger]|uniref:Uncharacterized protein n=1 Tax=Conger conger TaxID=82655 RepID=A0A9Q1I045_CONCO|nr:hypothetical protein COCON_G00110640 [Conger conger]